MVIESSEENGLSIKEFLSSIGSQKPFFWNAYKLVLKENNFEFSIPKGISWGNRQCMSSSSEISRNQKLTQGLGDISKKWIYMRHQTIIMKIQTMFVTLFLRSKTTQINSTLLYLLVARYKNCAELQSQFLLQSHDHLS